MVDYIENIVNRSHLTIVNILSKLEIRRNKYYEWKKRYGTTNNHNGKQPKKHWLTPDEKKAIIEFAKDTIGKADYYLHDGYRRLTYMGMDENKFACSPTSVYRVLSAAGLLNKWNNTKRSSKGSGYKQPGGPHKEWHTDIKYINYRGTFLFFIGIIDGYSRYIVHHELRTAMTELDIEIVLQRAVEKYPNEKPRLITDNGSQYLSKDFGLFLKESGLKHIRTSPSYPQSNGKIERFHRTLEEECLRTSSFFSIEDAQKQISEYVDEYNNNRLHSALFYLRPFDFINGKADELLKEREDKLNRASEKREQYWEDKNKMNNHVA